MDSFPAHTAFNPVTNIEDVFAAVQHGAATHGVVPVENSSNGAVVFTLDLFADLERRYPDVLICGEAYVRIEHCLLGFPAAAGSTSEEPSASASASVDLSHIRKLYSHPQAWGQCKTFLETRLRGIERVDCSSTSRAAEEAAADATGASAAVSSAVAAKMAGGVEVLVRGINDRGDNTTRFFVLRRKEDEELGEGEGDGEEEGGWKSLVGFTVGHDDPGALADALGVFKPYRLNLTSINTRPSGVGRWNYVFFVEFRGRRRAGGVGAVNAALADLGRVVRSWRWLGSWESKVAT